MKLTHYQVLGVAKSATSEQIVDRFLQLTTEHNPDQYLDVRSKFAQVGSPLLLTLLDEKIASSKETYNSIILAYQILSDPKSREEYDIQISQPDWQYQSAPLSYSIDPPWFELKNLKWNEAKTLQVVLKFDRNLTNYEKPNLEFACDIGLEQPTVKSNVGNQIIYQFSIDSTKMEPGKQVTELRFTINNEKTNSLLVREFITLYSDVESPPQNFPITTSNSNHLECGPLQVGTKQTKRVTIVNKGDPMWTIPTFEWVGNKPNWAGPIQVHTTPGRITPLDITFNVDTTHCIPNTYKAKIEARVGKQTVGIIPVILKVDKVPVPEIKVYAGGKGHIDFGTILWNETRHYDVRIENVGDPLTNFIRCTTNANWVLLSELTPSDLNTFPKHLRVSVDTKQLPTPGDYAGEFSIIEGNNIWTIKTTVRIGPKPNLVANTPFFRTKTMLGRVSGKVVVQNLGGYAPRTTIVWDKSDKRVNKPVIQPTLNPKTGEEDYPLVINFSINTRGIKDRYRNSLIVRVLDDHNNYVTSIQIPIEF